MFDLYKLITQYKYANVTHAFLCLLLTLPPAALISVMSTWAEDYVNVLLSLYNYTIGFAKNIILLFLLWLQLLLVLFWGFIIMYINNDYLLTLGITY